jgi:hypothetical protein
MIVVLGCGLFCFNYWQGTAVMYRVLARSYFGARRQGHPHDKAINWMVESRCQNPDTRNAVLRILNSQKDSLAEDPAPESEGDRLVWAIFFIFCKEHGVRPPDTHQVIAKIELEVRKVGLEEKFASEGFWQDEELG